MRIHGQELSRLELERRAGDVAAAGGVRKVILDDGSERGIRALEFRSGSGLTFDVLVDRAMDIGPAEYQGRSFGWRSETGLRHPALHENDAEGGLGWLRSFSGLQVTGGLDHIFCAEEVDASQYKYPARQKMQHGIHGRIANIPARLLGYGESWDGDRCVLWAEGEVRQAAVFGENLRLRRRIESEVGGHTIRLHDMVRNDGFDKSPHMLLYHINLGWPLIDKDTQFVAPIVGTRWHSPSVREQRTSYRIFPDPMPNFVEQAYEHELLADAEGKMRVAVLNHRLKFGLMLEWNASGFPRFVQWMHLREGSYVMGIEPCTHHVEGDQAARKDGSMIWLDHGESRSYETVFTVLDGEEALQGAAARIRAVAQQPEADVPPLR
jgi:hypothetical protein